MARHVDFDAAWAELQPTQAAPTVTIEGETITLPQSRPVAVVLLAARLRDPEQRREVTFTHLVEVVSIALGADRVQRWVDQGITEDKLTILALTLPGWWMVDDGDGEPEGEARPPATGAPTDRSSTTSSPDGGSSSPTSTASTGAPT